MNKFPTSLIPEVHAIVHDRFHDRLIPSKLLRAHQGLVHQREFRTQLHSESLPDLERVWLAREYAHQLGFRPEKRGYFANIARAYRAMFCDDRSDVAIRDFVRRRLETLDALSKKRLLH